MNTKFYIEAKNNLEYISQKISDDKYLNNLLYANIVTILETYLYKVFIFLLDNNPKLFKNLANSSKFKNQKVSLKLALSNIKSHIFIMIRRLTYHNLADIELIYKEVLKVDIKYDETILEIINIRHDIIHRNGYTKENITVVLSENDIIDTIKIFKNLIENIDKQIIEKYNF